MNGRLEDACGERESAPTLTALTIGVSLVRKSSQPSSSASLNALHSSTLLSAYYTSE
jgi:hypothetical protein